jgi:hypothetical protein
MRELNVFRKVIRREAARAAGAHPLSPSYLRGQLVGLGSEAEIINLPQDISALEAVQDADGAFWFASGYSAAGGPDPIGPAP